MPKRDENGKFISEDKAKNQKEKIKEKEEKRKKQKRRKKSLKRLLNRLSIPVTSIICNLPFNHTTKLRTKMAR